MDNFTASNCLKRRVNIFSTLLWRFDDWSSSFFIFGTEWSVEDTFLLEDKASLFSALLGLACPWYSTIMILTFLAATSILLQRARHIWPSWVVNFYFLYNITLQIKLCITKVRLSFNQSWLIISNIFFWTSSAW